MTLIVNTTDILRLKICLCENYGYSKTENMFVREQNTFPAPQPLYVDII